MVVGGTLYASAELTDDEFDSGGYSNDQATRATTLTANEGPNFHYTNLTALDPDWYRIFVTAGKSLRVLVNFTYTTGDVDLFLYRENNYQTPMNESRRSETELQDREELEFFYVPASANYYILVNLTWGECTYDLTVNVSATARQDDRFEENDDPQAASSLSLPTFNTTYFTTVTNLSGEDTDYYDVNIPEGLNLTVELTYDTYGGIFSELALSVHYIVGPVRWDFYNQWHQPNWNAWSLHNQTSPTPGIKTLNFLTNYSGPYKVVVEPGGYSGGPGAVNFNPKYSLTFNASRTWRPRALSIQINGDANETRGLYETYRDEDGRTRENFLVLSARNVDNGSEMQFFNGRPGDDLDDPQRWSAWISYDTVYPRYSLAQGISPSQFYSYRNNYIYVFFRVRNENGTSAIAYDRIFYRIEYDRDDDDDEDIPGTPLGWLLLAAVLAAIPVAVRTRGPRAFEPRE